MSWNPAKIVSALAVSLVVAAGAIAVSASPAAAAGCTGSYCIGHDPYNKGCSKGSSRTVYAYYEGVAVARATNWYSPNCVANWTEGALTTAGKNKGLGIYLESFNPGYYPFMCYYNNQSDLGLFTENCQQPYDKTINAWTDMVDGTGPAGSKVVVVNKTNGHQVTVSDEVWQ